MRNERTHARGDRRLALLANPGAQLDRAIVLGRGVGGLAPPRHVTRAIEFYAAVVETERNRRAQRHSPAVLQMRVPHKVAHVGRRRREMQSTGQRSQKATPRVAGASTRASA